MSIIDLTLPLFHHMPVFPGDPEVEIVQIHQLEREGWNLRSLELTTHIGTHLNVPSHMLEGGKSLDAYTIDDFFGPARLFRNIASIEQGVGVVFDQQNITTEIATRLIELKPKFVGLSAKFEFDIELEKQLLQAGIISYENLTNTDQLPEEFEFYGIPLNIKDADGSPVRAFAVI